MFGFFNRKDTPEAERIETAEQMAFTEKLSGMGDKLSKVDDSPVLTASSIGRQQI